MAAVLVDVNKFFGTFLEVLNMMKDINLLSTFAFSYLTFQDSSRMLIQRRHLQVLVKFLEEAKQVLDHLTSHSKDGFEDIVLDFERRQSIVPERDNGSASCNEEAKSHENTFGAHCESRRYEQLKGSSGHETQFNPTAQQRFVSVRDPASCDLPAHRFSPLNESQYNTSDSISHGNHYSVNQTCYPMNSSSVTHDNSLPTHGTHYGMTNQMVINSHFMQAESDCENAFDNSSASHVMRFPSCGRDSSMKHFISTNSSANQESQFMSHPKQQDFSSKPSCEFAQHNETRDSHFPSPGNFSPTNESNCDTLYTSRCDTTQEAHFSCDTSYEASNHSANGIHGTSVQFQTQGDTGHSSHYGHTTVTNDANYQSQNKNQSAFSLTSSLSTPQYPSCQETPIKMQFQRNESTPAKLHYTSASSMNEPRFAPLTVSDSYVTANNETCGAEITSRNEETPGRRYVSSFKWGGLNDSDDSFDPSSPSPPEPESQSQSGDLQMVMSSEMEGRNDVAKQNNPTIPQDGDSFACVRNTSGVGSDEKTDRRLAILDGAKSEGGKWRCPLCTRSFINRANLERHYRGHLGEKAFPCSHCSKGFSSKVRLDAHLVRQHNLNKESATPCPICGKLFTTRSALETHRLTHADENEKPFPCNICRKRFSQKVVLDAHILRHGGPNLYKFRCEMCSKTFPTRAKLKFHWRIHGSNQLSCDQCPKHFANQMLLRVHQATHTDASQRPFRCTQCPKTFTSNYKLQQHIETHGQTNQYSCTQCSAEFRCRATLVSHIRTHHSESPRIYPCPVPECPDVNTIFPTVKQLDQHLVSHGLAPSRCHKCSSCQKIFSRRTNLREHERACHQNLPPDEARPHACSLCPKRFKQKSKLKAHISTHTQEPGWACSTCGKRFYRADLLRTHEATHTGNKPFTCEVCARRFVTHSMLRSHQNIHQPQPDSGIEVACPSCDKKFKNKRTLALHVKSHAESLEFTCGTCGKQFARRVHYDGHMRTHSAIRPYSCTVCGRTFRERKHRVDHMRRLHPNEVLGGGELTLQGLIDSITADDGLDASGSGGGFENDVNSDPLASLAQLSSSGMQHLLADPTQSASQSHNSQVDDNQLPRLNHLNQNFGRHPQNVSLEGEIDKSNQSGQVSHISQSFPPQPQSISRVSNGLAESFRSQSHNISLDQVDTTSSGQVSLLNQNFSSQSQTLTLLHNEYSALKSNENVASLSSGLQSLPPSGFSCSDSDALSSIPELSELVASATSHGHSLQSIESHSCSQSDLCSHFSIDRIPHTKDPNDCTHNKMLEKEQSPGSESLGPKLSEMLTLSM